MWLLASPYRADPDMMTDWVLAQSEWGVQVLELQQQFATATWWFWMSGWYAPATAAWAWPGLATREPARLTAEA